MNGIIRPAFQPSLKATIKGALRSTINKTSRFFTQFDEVSRSYVNITSPITLDNSSPWEITFDCVPTETARSNGFRAFDSNTGDFIKLFNADDPSSPNMIRVKQQGGAANFDNALLGVDRSALNRFSIKNDGLGALTLLINGEQVGVKGAFSSFTLDLIGLGTDFNDDAAGVIANLKVSVNDSLVLDMPIDQSYTPANNTVIDRSPSGNNGTFVNVAGGDSTFYELIGNSWIGVNIAPSGTFTKNSDESLEITLTDNLKVGRRYLVAFNYDNNSSTPGVRLGSPVAGAYGDQLLSNAVNETYSSVITASSTSGMFISGTASRAVIRTISVRELLEVAQ